MRRELHAGARHLPQPFRVLETDDDDVVWGRTAPYSDPIASSLVLSNVKCFASWMKSARPRRYRQLACGNGPRRRWSGRRV